MYFTFDMEKKKEIIYYLAGEKRKKKKYKDTRHRCFVEGKRKIKTN